MLAAESFCYKEIIDLQDFKAVDGFSVFFQYLFLTSQIDANIILALESLRWS